MEKKKNKDSPLRGDDYNNDYNHNPYDEIYITYH